MNLIVEMEACYHYHEEGWEEEEYYEVEDEAAEKVLKAELASHGGKLTMEEVKALIESGKSELSEMHHDLFEMIVEHDKEFFFDIIESEELQEQFDEEYEEEEVTPEDIECYLEYLRKVECVDTEAEYSDIEEVREDYLSFKYDEAFEEFKEEFESLPDEERAKRLGFALEDVRENTNGTYTIREEK